MFTEAPNITAPKQTENQLFFNALPEEGLQPFVLVQANYIADYETEYQGETKVFNALEFFFATYDTEVGGWFFIKTWPKNYSMDERSWYSALVKAMTGELPEAGSNVNWYMGKACMLNIVNVPKTSKKGKDYTVSKIDGRAVPVPKGMQLPDATEATAAFEAELKRIEQEREEYQKEQEAVAAGSTGTDEEPPF